MTGPGMSMQLGQHQKQIMQLAPRMIQSMEILQLPVMALQERIQTELQENPVLELREAARDDGPAGEDETPREWEAETPAADPDSRELVIDVNSDGNDDFDRLEAINADWSDHFNEEHRPSSNRIEEEGDKKHLAETNMVSRPQSLQDYLGDQLNLLDAAEDDIELARIVLAYVDENGYLTSPLEEIAQACGPDVSLAVVEAALRLIQKLDPPGVGARDLRECLLLQLTPETPYGDVLRELIQNHLEDIQHNRLPVIQKRTGYDLDTVHEAIDALRHLNPKPGAQFRSDNVQYVVPDIVVDRNEKGEYEVRLLDDWTPNVRISKRYFELYKDKRSDPRAREFLAKKIQAAKWLMEAIEQRRNTLLKVTRAIITRQHNFLDHGPEHIEPLKMQQIADEVHVHVTTVSRAVDDKWVQTPRGVFPLKRFFGGGTKNTATGEDVAYEAIKKKLQELVQLEDKCEPLSDEDLVKMLNEAGYPVARRTVTKYRKLMDIPSSRERKVWK